MVSTTRMAEIAALIGDPARAAMLTGLMDGRALTATELAATAGVTPQTASSHLSRLVDAGLLRVERQGRHRYHRLASPEVARMLEGIMQVASGLAPARPVVVGPRDATITWRVGWGWRSPMRWWPADSWISTPRRALSPTAAWRCFAGWGSRRTPAGGSACCAGPAWIGASGARISPGCSAPPCARIASTKAGSAVSPPAAPSLSRRWDGGCCAKPSACERCDRPARRMQCIPGMPPEGTP